MFPHGGPGIGLVLLRTAAASMFALNILHPFNFSSPALYWLVVLIIGLISLGIVLGFLTPILATITCIAAIANLLLADQPANLVYILRILTSAALIFLGPGAYSVDAKLFGFRVTVLPPRRDQKSSPVSN